MGQGYFAKRDGKWGSGGSGAAAQEMENEHDQADDQKNVDKSRTDVESQKAEQPEND
jgi:hypothetical protein